MLLFNSIRDGVAIFYFTDYVRSAYKLPHLGWTLGTLYLLLGQLGNMAGVALARARWRRASARKEHLPRQWVRQRY